MTDIIPLKVRRTLGDTDALAEFEVGDTTALVHGGTSATTASGARTNIGAASQVDLDLHENDNTNGHGVTAAQTGAVALSEKAVANGVATLDGGGKIPAAQIPAVSLPEVHVVADTTARLALTVQEGDEAIQLDDGSHWIYDGSAWHNRPQPSVIFGSEYQAETHESLESTTSATPILYHTWVTSNLPVGDYRLIWIPIFSTSQGAGKRIHIDLYRNAVLEGHPIHQKSAKDDESYLSLNSGSIDSQTRIILLNSISGVQTFTVEYASQAATKEVNMISNQFELWRVA